jgi:hypothetical protein
MGDLSISLFLQRKMLGPQKINKNKLNIPFSLSFPATGNLCSLFLDIYIGDYIFNQTIFRAHDFRTS